MKAQRVSEPHVEARGKVGEAADGADTRRASRRRKTALIAGLLSLVLLLFLELALRLIALVPRESRLYVVDPDVGYRLREGVELEEGERTNSRGFNDVEWESAKPAGVTRIALVGDSFVFGFVPRAESLTLALQREADEAGVPVQVLNMGIPSAEPKRYAATIAHDCVEMRVDVVCAVFFVGNDITQCHPDFRTRLWLGAPHEVLRSPLLVGLSPEYSYLYRTARAVRRIVREKLDPPASGSFTEGTFLSIERQRMGVYALEPSRMVRRSFAGALEALENLARAARSNGMEIVVLLAPDQLQVETALRERLASRYGLELDRFDFEKPQRVLTEALGRSGIPVVDLLPSLREAHAVSGPVYLERDTHWNAAGHEAVARGAWPALGASSSPPPPREAPRSP